MADKEISDFEYHLKEIFRISKEKYDIDNPLDKCKYREVIVAEQLGHEVFKGASGGKNNDATYGADAVGKEDGRKKEYKTVSLTPIQYGKWINGKMRKAATMIYNGSYTKETINRYRDTDHIISIFYNEKNICNVEVPIDHVIDSLHEVLAKKIKKEKETGKKVTTNCNPVKVQFINNAPTIGKVL